MPCDPSVRKPFVCVKAVEMATERRFTFFDSLFRNASLCAGSVREVPPDYTAGTLCLVILQCGSLLSVSKQSKWQLREGLRFLTVCSETLLSVPDQ